MLSFNSAIDIGNYDDAYTALTRLTNYEMYSHLQMYAHSSQRSALEALVVAMIEHEQAGRLCAYPFPSLQDLVDEILSSRTEDVVEIRSQPSYHKVLFSWRVRHGDFQGGTSIFVLSSNES
jgi:hypothetical protein